MQNQQRECKECLAHARHSGDWRARPHVGTPFSHETSAGSYIQVLYNHLKTCVLVPFMTSTCQKRLFCPLFIHAGPKNV